jgi:putative alpha-1,2-mannosidase
MIRKIFLTSFVLLLSINISAQQNQKLKTPYDYVDPFIGTDDMGHTFPGAAVPFGLVQLSPETDTAMYRLSIL